MRRSVPFFDEKEVEKIMEERGVSYDEATRIASTTMDGAYQTPGGGICARQTACHELGYNEGLPPSKGQEEGRKATLSALGVSNDGEADRLVDEWLRVHGGCKEK